MKSILKRVTYGVLAASVLAGAAAGYAHLNSYEYNKGRIEIDARYDRGACEQARPILVEIRNRSNRQLEFIRFDLEGKQAGRSTVIATQSIASDFLVDAGEMLSKCWPTNMTDHHTIYQLQAYSWSIGEHFAVVFEE